MSPLRRLTTCDPLLHRRAAQGDERARRRLAARHVERITLLASVVSEGDDELDALAAKGFSLALHSGRRFDDALVTAFADLAAARPHGGRARARLAVLLSEVEGRPDQDVARLLHLEPSAVHALLSGADGAATSRRCRGWGLVTPRARLTPAERHARDGHLQLCRRCREHLAAVERARAQLLGGSAGAVTAAAATQLVPLGAFLGTKAAAGVVAAAGAAVLATGGAVAVTHHAVPHTPAPRPATAPVAPRPSAPAPAVVPARPQSTARPAPAVPAPAPARRTPRATLPPLPVPPVKVPVLPLPSALPLPLPTSLPLPVASIVHGVLTP